MFLFLQSLPSVRLPRGVGFCPPMHWDDVKGSLYPDSADAEDFGYERVLRLLRFLRGERASTFAGREGVVEEWSDRVQPHSPRLAGRTWYGGGSDRKSVVEGKGVDLGG